MNKEKRFWFWYIVFIVSLITIYGLAITWIQWNHYNEVIKMSKELFENWIVPGETQLIIMLM